MKIVVLHPPMYPVNHKFYNLLAEKVEIVVYQIGEHPYYHTHWTSKEIRGIDFNYKLKIYGKGRLSFYKQLNPTFLLELMKEKPDIVLSVAFWFPSFYIALLKNIFNYKFMVVTDMINDTETHAKGLKQFLRRYIAKKVDTFISASDLTSKYLRDTFHHHNIILSLQTIDVSQWKNHFDKINDSDSIRLKYNIDKSINVMLGVGNFIEKKNWKLVFSAIKNIDNILFILVGDGALKNEYVKTIKELNIESKVRIVGKKSGTSLLEYYKISDFFVFPSYFDQFGFVTAEALLCGIPVLCSKKTGSSHLIKDNINGYLIDPNKNIEEYIKLVIQNIDTLKPNTQKSIINYTLENRVEEFINIFNNIMKGKECKKQ